MGAVHDAVVELLTFNINTSLGKLQAWLLCIAVCATCGSAAGQLVVSNTRVIFTAGSKLVEFAVSNQSKELQTIRAWIDSGDAQVAPDDVQAPFFVMPPVSKIKPGGKQTLRISFTGEHVPTGQESLYYLNILNLAPVSEQQDSQNAMRFHARSRFKVLLRPPALPGDPSEAARQLPWLLDPAGAAERLTANNVSPYFLSLVNIRLMRGKQPMQELESSTVAPYSSVSFPLQSQGSDAHGATSVEYQYIDDYGLYRDGVFVFKTMD